MLNAQILEYAIKGINAEIDELEKVIHQGNKFLKQYENGEKPKTEKTQYEIHVIIRKKKDEIEKLAKFKDDLKWQLAEIEEK